MEKILEYQRLDTELFRLNREINKNENKKDANEMLDFMKESKFHIINLDKESQATMDEIEKLKNVQEKGISLVEKYSKQDSSELNKEQLQDVITKLSQTNSQLKDLENRLYNVQKKITNILQDFDSTKKKMTIAKTKRQDSKTKFEEFYKEKEPQILELKKQISSLEKEIEPNVINKYKALKQDRIFPVIVPLVNNKQCGGCRMELPSGQVEKIKNAGKLECPSCRRLIYIKEQE